MYINLHMSTSICKIISCKGKRWVKVKWYVHLYFKKCSITEFFKHYKRKETSRMNPHTPIAQLPVTINPWWILFYILALFIPPPQIILQQFQT